MDKTTFILQLIMIALFVLLAVLVVMAGNELIKQESKVRNRIRSLSSGSAEISADEFLRIYSMKSGRSNRLNLSDFTGIYIIHNLTNGKYYVGQSKNVFRRINSHLNGRGNGDVYADFVYGDQFSVRAIPLESSGYRSIDALERDAIRTYNAFEHGYNKNRGNNR